MGGRPFRKDIEPSCLYCAYSGQISETQVACAKRGVVPAGSGCRRFRYDPLRRVPPRPAALDTSRLREKDFSL